MKSLMTPLTAYDYKEIAKRRRLSARQTQGYIRFMLERFPRNFDKGYAYQWATRFRKGTAWAEGDAEARRVLQKIHVYQQVPIGL